MLELLLGVCKKRDEERKEEREGERKEERREKRGGKRARHNFRQRQSKEEERETARFAFLAFSFYTNTLELLFLYCSASSPAHGSGHAPRRGARGRAEGEQSAGRFDSVDDGGERRRRAIEQKMLPLFLSTSASPACSLATCMRREHHVNARCDLELHNHAARCECEGNKRCLSFKRFAATGFFDSLSSPNVLSLLLLRIPNKPLNQHRSSRRSTSTSGARRTRSGKRPRERGRRRR